MISEKRERLVHAATVALALVIMAPGIAGAGLLGWQILRWLKAGYWHSVSVIDAVVWAGVGVEWAQSPSAWIGVWRILNWLSAAAAGITLTIALILFVSRVIEEGSR